MGQTVRSDVVYKMYRRQLKQEKVWDARNQLCITGMIPGAISIRHHTRLGLHQKRTIFTKRLSIVEHAKSQAPIHIFITKQDGVEYLDDSTGIIRFRGDTYPTVMKNPKRIDFRGEYVPTHLVESFGLEEFSPQECLDMGAEIIRLFSFDAFSLCNVEAILKRECNLLSVEEFKGKSGDDLFKRMSRQAFLAEGVAQKICFEELSRKSLLNRVCGAGNWNSGLGVYHVCATCWPISFQQKLESGGYVRVGEPGEE